MPLNSPEMDTDRYAEIKIRQDPCESAARFLELAAVLFRPALDDNFLIRIKLDGVATLAVEVAEEAVLPTAKRKIGHGGGNSNVDSDIASGRFVAESPRSGTAGCK
jgi:hypothetical protein